MNRNKHLFTIISLLCIVLIIGFVYPSLFFLAFLSVMIVIGSLLIAWAAEASEVIISQALALVVVALLQVFPEFMIEATISWAKDVPNMLSNFTGANRILVGIGWPLVFFTTSSPGKSSRGAILFFVSVCVSFDNGLESR